jgi:DNA-binding transcriptional MerR regulator
MPIQRIASTRYTISQLSRLFDVTARALRFYEQIGLVEPNRSGQNRVYSRGDYQRIQVITGARKAGLSLDHIRELLALYDPADRGEAQIRKAIERVHQRMVDLDAQRDSAALKLAELEFRLERVKAPDALLTQFTRRPGPEDSARPEAR